MTAEVIRDFEVVRNPEDVPETQAITIMPPPASLAVVRPPKAVLEEAQEAATALVDLIKSKPELTVKLSGNTYLKFEAWQTIGKFYGASPKVTETKYLEYGEVTGFEAKAVIINSNGMEISGAEAMCLNDEPNWKKKPLFQLKSMAQTRASAKALRNVFAWVVVLAGYKPTPAEEMDGIKPRAEKPQEPLVKAEGVIEEVIPSSGMLFFKIGSEIYAVDRFQKSLKEQLGEAKGAFVELMVTAPRSTGAKEYREVREVLKLESNVPF